MAVESGFFEAEWDPELYNEETHELGDWDRKYLAEQFARYFSKFISNGVLNDVPNQLKVSPSELMTLEVSVGFAFINGYWCYNPEPLALYVPLNQSPSTRYDSVRVRWNAITREIEIVYIADDIVNVRNDLYYDLQIAQVKVEPSTTSIVAADITDTRSNETLCGLINIVKAEDIGDINNLQTINKSSVVAAINEVNAGVNEIKSKDFIILHSTFTFSQNNTCTIVDERITSESLADVYFDSSSFDIAQRADISVETYQGYLVLTASRTPTGTVSGTIRIRVV